MSPTEQETASAGDLVGRIRAALSSAPARPRVTLPEPPRDAHGRFATAVDDSSDAAVSAD